MKAQCHVVASHCPVVRVTVMWCGVDGHSVVWLAVEWVAVVWMAVVWVTVVWVTVVWCGWSWCGWP